MFCVRRLNTSKSVFTLQVQSRPGFVLSAASNVKHQRRLGSRESWQGTQGIKKFLYVGLALRHRPYPPMGLGMSAAPRKGNQGRG